MAAVVVATSVACGVGSASVARPPSFPNLVALYRYDAGAPTGFTDHGIELRNGAVIHDITFASPVAGTVTAFLVTPSSDGRHPALLFAPGLYGGRNDDLAEAVDYARRGVVSLLIDPPHVRPGGPVLIRCRARDRLPFVQYVVDLRRGIDVLLERDDVDRDRIGVVGFSYGSAVAAVLAGVEHRLHAAVLESGRANNSRFFRDQCASQLTKRGLAAYARAMRFSDGVLYVRHAAPTALLLQNGRRDPFTPLREARALHAAATKPKTVKWYAAGHELNEQASRDREAWLARELGFEGARLLVKPRVLARIQVGSQPLGLEYGAGSIWAANFGSEDVARIDPQANKVTAHVPVGTAVYGLAFGAGSLWVSAYDSTYLTRIDPATNGVVARVDVGTQQAEVTATDDAVWVAVYGGGTVVKIDPATNKVVARIAVGGNPEDVALFAGAVWVPNENGTLERIDPATNAVVATIRVGADPDYAVPCRGRLWISDLAGPWIRLVDPARNRVTSRIKVGPGNAGVACGSSTWVATYYSGRLLRVNPRTRKVSARLVLGGQPRSVVIAAGSVWVSQQRNGTVTRVRGS